MVKVIEKTLEERSEEEEYDRILGITRSIAESQRIDTFLRPHCIAIGTDISVYPNRYSMHEERFVIVKNPDNYDLAFRLALAYEDVVRREFTLKKDY